MSEKCIAATAERDLAMAATPIDRRKILDVRHPMNRVRYELQIIGQPTPKKNPGPAVWMTVSLPQAFLLREVL